MPADKCNTLYEYIMSMIKSHTITQIATGEVTIKKSSFSVTPHYRHFKDKSFF